MQKIGEMLREKRLAKGLTFDQIEQDTKIRKRYLEALEKEEWQLIPGAVYLKGFLKTYARYLGLDEQEILNLYQETSFTLPEKPMPVKNHQVDMPQRPKGKTGLIVGLLSLALLLGFQFLYTTYLKGPENPLPNPPVSDNKPINPAPEGGVNEPKPEPNIPEIPVVESITLKIIGIEARCWVRISGDQGIIFEGSIVKGEEKTFSTAQKLNFTLGNAGVVQVYLNDQDLGILGKPGDVVRKSYILDNNEIKEASS